MAHAFTAQRHNLALCARRLDQLTELREQLLRDFPAIHVSIQVLDVTDYLQVFEVFHEFNKEFSSIDRIIVNAGLGKGPSLGTGCFDANLATANTNFVDTLAQCEAAMEIFRAQGRGHLVTVASVAAIRGQKNASLTYAATKAGLASMSEGLRLECRDTAIYVTTLFPGFISTEITKYSGKKPFQVDLTTGCKAMVRAIERKPATACVPSCPWTPISFILK